MGKGNFTEEFKRDAVRQITERAIRYRRSRSGSGSDPEAVTTTGSHLSSGEAERNLLRARHEYRLICV